MMRGMFDPDRLYIATFDSDDYGMRSYWLTGQQLNDGYKPVGMYLFSVLPS